MQENALAVHQGDGAEHWVVEKCLLLGLLLLLRQRQHCHEEARDKHLIHHEPGHPESVDGSGLNLFIEK